VQISGGPHLDRPTPKENADLGVKSSKNRKNPIAKTKFGNGKFVRTPKPQATAKKLTKGSKKEKDEKSGQKDVINPLPAQDLHPPDTDTPSRNLRSGQELDISIGVPSQNNRTWKKQARS